MSSESAQAAEDATASVRRKPAVVKPRAGVPVWRTSKPDAALAAAVDVARDALATIAGPGEIGEHLGARSEGDRLVTHLFESHLRGYVGWQWFAVLTRNSRSKVITVSELGLLPSEDSILAPEWVPWAERVRPEDEESVPEASEAEPGVESGPAPTTPLIAEDEEAEPRGGAEDESDADDEADATEETSVKPEAE